MDTKRDKGIIDKAKEAVGKVAEKAANVTGEVLERGAELARAGATGRINRTGIDMSPAHAKETVEGAKEGIPSSPGDVNALSEVRWAYGHDAEPAGTMPPPASVKGAAATAAAAARGERATFLLDKLGERLAFERTGVRLYEELLTLFDVHGGFEGGPTRAQIETARAEEAAHFGLVRDAIETMGGDPTAVTPMANLVARESLGLLQVLTDPRSRLPDGLHAILVAELADHENWEALVRLARGNVPDELVRRFEAAVVDEDRHLVWVREWVAAHERSEAGITRTPRPEESPVAPPAP